MRLHLHLSPDVRMRIPGRYQRFFSRAFLYALLLLLIPAQATSGQDLVVIYSVGTAPVYSQVAGDLKSYLNEECDQTSGSCSPEQTLIITASPGDDAPTIPPDTRLIITLGQRAGEVIGNMRTGIPVLYALIPQTAYQKLAKDSPNSAIFLDQPIRRLFLLAGIIRPDPHIGLLMSPLTESLKSELISDSEQRGIPLTYRDVGTKDRVGPLLKEVLEESNILLALPDPNIFNSTTIFNILLSSYHKRIPVIGFSSAYVKAGALIAAYSTPTDIARHLAEYAFSYLGSGAEAMPGPMYPKYFSVSVNQSVARSLGISLPDETVIVQRIMEQSKP